jgi:hypothetical protein
MTRLAATLPGYASVARASEVLHLAPRSVRDLIYAGRIPSLRIGRLHYIRAADLEAERRRRLGLPARRLTPRRHSETRRHPATVPRNHSLDAALRRQRAVERAELVSQWARRHQTLSPRLPAHVRAAVEPVTCDACGRVMRQGRYVELTTDSGEASSLCVTCGRRALLQWADQRRQEAAAARELSHSLGEPEPVDARPAALLQQALLPATVPEAAPQPADEPLPAALHEALPEAADELLPAAFREGMPEAADELLPAAFREGMPEAADELLPAALREAPPEPADAPLNPRAA